MKTFKTAVIGCGMISKNHFKALKNVENAECVVACDIRPERAAAAAETYGIPHTETEYHRLLDNPEIDVVHICLPHYLHAQVAIEAMEHGKHVLCEKPMALDPADAEKMIEVRDRTGRTLGICFQNRYNDSSRYMRSLMDSGRMGKVLGARGAVFWNRNPEYYTESPASVQISKTCSSRNGLSSASVPGVVKTSTRARKTSTAEIVAVSS